jgi:hypothetical protein
MKNSRFVPAIFFLITGALLLNGCGQPFLEKPTGPEGQLLVSLSGNRVASSLSARTMLPMDPEFTRYELVFMADPSGSAPAPNLEPYVLYNSTMQLHLTAGTYHIIARGYAGDAAAAQSDLRTVSISNGELTPVEFILKPYMEPSVNGTLRYSLSWDGFSRMPDRAELLIETYADSQGVSNIAPIPISLIPGDLTAGSSPGTILLLRKDDALVKLTGSLTLPPGEYRLTMSVTLDAGGEAVSRMDLAHVYSNLSTPASFYYGDGDLLIANTGVDLGPGFITRFTFSETPNAASVIGSVPGTDGTRLIMVVVPSGTPLDNLTPIVETAPGARIISHSPADPEQPTIFVTGEINFANPSVWTAEGRTGTIQSYTVKVTEAPSTECRIVDFFFKEVPGAAVAIDEDSGTIGVIVPFGTDTNLTPVISIIGKSVVQYDGGVETPLDGDTLDFSSTVTFRVHPADAALPPKDYTVTVTPAANTDAEISAFAIDGYPGIAAIPGAGIETSPGSDGYYPITLELPFGASLKNLSPLIQYKGKSVDPDPGAAQDFNVPVYYTVTAADNITTKRYKVVLSNQPGNSDTGIFDFVVVNVPNSKVVIGQKPRWDGKIPIVIQVPYETNGSPTDENNLIPAITLSSPATSGIAKIHADPAYAAEAPSGTPIRFTNQEAVYRVTPQAGPYQDYVVVVSRDVQYYYVNGLTGSDTWPDVYNGGSESQPFKTLAYAVYRASQHTVNKIFVSGVLNNSTEGGAYEDASVAWPEGFRPSGGDSGSVFDLRGTNGKKITVTGVGVNAALVGTQGKRVLSVTGGADITFENITITGGNTTSGSGGGIYIGGNSRVKFTGGNITGNTAVSGGGVYVNDDTENGDYDFTLINSTVSGNTATGTSTAAGALAGGGGVYVNDKALFWFVGGTISGNKTGGSGGGVLINGYTAPNESATKRGDEYGLLMSGGSISGNFSRGGIAPHGGGGVYVAKGAFEMLGGAITENESTRQGGGVFIAYHSRFTASGDASINNNKGVGSSKAICNRGYTEMRGNAQADSVYVWINEQSTYAGGNAFHIAESARIGGLVLAFSEYSGPNPNKVNIEAIDNKTDPVCRIDFEMHLINNYTTFAETSINDWLGKKVVENGSNLVPVDRFPLNTLVGKTTMNLTAYKLDSSGVLVRR